MVGFVGLAALVPLSRAALGGMSGLWLVGAALYPLTGVAAWLVWRRIDIGIERKRAALRQWGWQLLLGGLWPAALYGTGSSALALALLTLLLLASGMTWRAFARLQAGAAWLLLPYCAWLLFVALTAADHFWQSTI